MRGQGALLSRFGWLHGAPKAMKLRHDNGLVFGSRLYRRLVADYGLEQEFTTPYAPQSRHGGRLCERFIKTFKKELCWIRSFSSLEAARRAVTSGVHSDNTERPHRSLNYLTPHQTHRNKCNKLAA